MEKIIRKYNKQGQCINSKRLDDREYICKYNDKGQKIYTKDFNGKEKWRIYSENGELWPNVDDSSIEQQFEYGIKGNVSKITRSDGSYIIYLYDIDKLIYSRNNNNFKKWYFHNNDGNLIQVTDSIGFSKYMDYDEKGNKIHQVINNLYTLEEWWEYDDRNNPTKYTNSDGVEIQYKNIYE